MTTLPGSLRLRYPNRRDLELRDLSNRIQERAGCPVDIALREVQRAEDQARRHAVGDLCFGDELATPGGHFDQDLSAMSRRAASSALISTRASG